MKKPYWEGKHYAFSAIKNVNIFRVMQAQIRRTSTVCSATARCMHWAINAGGDFSE